MKITKYMAYGVVALSALAASSCTDDLNVEPTDPNTKVTLDSKEDYLALLASAYNDLITGEGLNVSDGGAGSWTRCHFNLQELPTDECFISYAWNDPGYEVLNFGTWGNVNEWMYAAYSRENHLAKVASVFIENLAGAPADYFTDAERKAMDAEARTLRAYANWNLIDLFGRGPWITESSPTGVAPETYDRKQMFEGTVADLKSCLDNLIPAAQQTYGRISREAGYMLLAKLYLNAQVYTGTPMWQECADALKNVVGTGISLAPDYKYLFCADNDQYVGNGEIIWGLPCDQNATMTYGATTYLTAAAWLRSAPADVLAELNSFGDPWTGLRLRPELSQALQGDPRRLIYEGSYQEDIPNLSTTDETSCGYMLTKYRNTTSSDYYNTRIIQNNAAVDAVVAAIDADPSLTDEQKEAKKKEAEKDRINYNNGSQISNIDYPIFRLADAYLMLAECQLNGASVNINGKDGYAYLNEVRARVGLPAINQPSATEILNERQCELYMEGHRRSDLIRFGRFAGGNYRWSWKGGVYEGAALPEYRELYAIPYQYEMTVGQNPGY